MLKNELRRHFKIAFTICGRNKRRSLIEGFVRSIIFGNTGRFKHSTVHTLDIANTRWCNDSTRALLVGTTAIRESICCGAWR